MPDTRGGPNKRGEWADFFTHYMKNSGEGRFFPPVYYLTNNGSVELLSEINKREGGSPYIKHL